MLSLITSVRRSAIVMFGGLFLFVPTAVHAQARGNSAVDAQEEGGFPDASFEGGEGILFRIDLAREEPAEASAESNSGVKGWMNNVSRFCDWPLCRT